MKLKTTASGWDYLELAPQGESVQDFVIFHGYGADAYNLSFLQELEPRGRWLFPQAGMDASSIRTWFDIDPETFQRALVTKEPLINESFLDRKKEIMQFILDLKLNTKNLIIGGFSQGAIVSASLALTEFTPKALILLSGGATLEILPDKKITSTSFFQSHGKQDPTLPFVAAEHLNQKLMKMNWQGEFHAFDGGHEVPPSILAKLKVYIANQITKQKIYKSS